MNRFGWKIGLWVVAAGCGYGGVAKASTATFDALGEGALDISFTTEGITFFDLDDRAGGGPVTFAIEQSDGTLSGPGFSPPNALGFGGWAPGPYPAFGQCGSFKFTTGTVQNFASVDVFEWMSYSGNTISLEAYLNGVLVNSMTIVLPGNGLINHWNLSVSGVLFDTLRVNGSGPTDRGVFFGLVDNVVVQTIDTRCDNIRRFNARCKSRGNIKAKVVMSTSEHDGQTITFAIDDEPFETVIVDHRAILKSCCYAGEHTVSVLDPPDCVAPVVVTCP